MFFPMYNLFYFTLILGTLIVVSSSSWFVAWIGLEMNVLSFIPIVSAEKKKESSEGGIKYFIVQTLGSLLILASSFFPFSDYLVYGGFFTFVALALKLGVAPFHIWFPSVLENLNWGDGLLLVTWQKLAPLYLLEFSWVAWVLIVSSSLVGAIGGFNQTSLKKIIAFSSINHLGWMLAGLYVDFYLMLKYYAIYVVLNILIISSFLVGSMSHISDFIFCSFFLKLMVFVNMFSLGGMPPLMGFFPKWGVILALFSSSLYLGLLLVFSSLVSLYFYMRLTYSFLFLNYNSFSTTIKGGYNLSLIILFGVSLFGGLFYGLGVLGL